MKDIIKIAFGIAGGLILASLVWFAASVMIAKSAVEQMNKVSQETAAQMQRMAQEAAQKQKAQAEEIAQAQRVAESQALRAKQAVVALRVEKEAAWKNYFKKSKECEDPPSISALGECANIEIRAKRKFEERWAKTHS